MKTVTQFKKSDQKIQVEILKATLTIFKTASVLVFFKCEFALEPLCQTEPESTGAAVRLENSFSRQDASLFISIIKRRKIRNFEDIYVIVKFPVPTISQDRSVSLTENIFVYHKIIT